MERPEDAIPDAPVYEATMDEMENLEELLARANELAMRYGAVRIDPPATWVQPPLRMNPSSRFFVRIQTLPASPFVHPELVKQANHTKPHQRKRTRRKPPTAADDDSDEPVVVTKDHKTASRERAARAASRSQRIRPQQNQSDHKILADYLANADFGAERTAPDPSLKVPPNPACTPAVSPPPEMHVSGPNALVKSDNKPPMPFPMGQTSIAHAFPRAPAPASQIQRSSFPTGQTEAVREAAVRLAEAFTGSAKAGPAPNATAIPPCPFSQRTAQEHMAKRTAEDQSTFPLVNVLPLPDDASGTATANVTQEMNTSSLVGSARENEYRGEVNHVHHDTETNWNAIKIRQEGNVQVSSVQQIHECIQLPENDAKSGGQVNTADETATEGLKCNTEKLRMKNGEAEGLPNLSNTQSLPVIAPLSHDLSISQPKTCPTTLTGLMPMNGSTTNAAIPVSMKSVETPCGKVRPDKSHDDAKRTAFVLPVPTQVPRQKETVPLGSMNESGTENLNWGLHRACTAVGTPVPECHLSAFGQSNTAIPLRSLPLSNHRSQHHVASIENCIFPPTMSSESNFANDQGIARPEMISRSEIPHYSLLPPSSHKSNVSVFRERPLLMKTGCQMVPHASNSPIRAPSGQVLKTDSTIARNKTEDIALLKSGPPILPQRREKTQDALEEKLFTGICPEAGNAPNDDRFYQKQCHEKEMHGPEQKVGGSHNAPVSHGLASSSDCHVSVFHPVLASNRDPGKSEQILSTAITTTPIQNVKKEDGITELNFPGAPNSNLIHKLPPPNIRCKAEPSFAGLSNISPSGPTLPSSNQETHWNPAFCGSEGLLDARRKVAIQTGTEIVEKMLAVATCSSHLTSMRLPSESVRIMTPTNQTMKHRASEQPYLNDENSGSRREDVMQIDNILNRGRQNILQPKEEGEKAPMSRTAQAQPAHSDKYVAFSPYAGVPSLDLARLHPTQDKLQEQLISNQAVIGTTPKRPLSFRQKEEKPRSEQLKSPPLVRQQLSHSSQPKEGGLNSEEAVPVVEKEAASRQGRPSGTILKPVPMVNVGTTNLPAEGSKDQSHVKSRAKRTPKRKMENRNSRYDQDGTGRLTKAIVFPDSGTPVSLAEYKKQAHEHHEETKMALNLLIQEGPDTSNIEPRFPKIDMHDVDTLEVEFWNAMTSGIRGKPITVAYGVDVEAEGAFDSTDMSYVEWYGADPTGRTPGKKKRGRRRKQTRPNTARRPRSNEHVSVKSTKQSLQPCADYLHNDDADDEMECDDGSTLSKLAAHREVLRAGKETLHTTESRPQRSKTEGPRSHVGTLNRDGLLRHMPRMPGINHSMFYIGQLFTRFCWHTEDAFLNSVSYLHPGSAEKVWYAVPPQYAPAFEEYAVANVFSPEILANESIGQALLMNKTTMFDPRRVRRKGVEVFRVVHKPGSFVLTAPRAYHAGFNCGFNVAEAVNFASPTWFPVGREASRFARQTYKPLCVPWEYLLFHEAKAMNDIGHGANARPTAAERLAINANVVARELNAIIMDGEMKIRKYAEKSNCRVAMLHQVDGLAKYNQVGPEFGNGAGMVCSLCAHTCHFYAEMCGSCDDSFEARCVDHFGEGHRMCLQENHKTVIVRRHDPVLLLDILGFLEKIAKIEIDPREQWRRYVGYLRTWETPLKTSGLRLRLNLKAAVSRLPPKVSKEKGNREKAVREKVIRNKMTRDKRRKSRKPRGMFPQPEVKSSRGMSPSPVEVLGDVEILSSIGVEHEERSRGEINFEEVVETTNKIPSLQ